MPAETTVAAKTSVARETTVDATTLGEGRHHCQRGHQRRNQNQATHVYILRR
jgi:hypothetical protein